MKQQFISKWSNWWIFDERASELNDAFKKELEEIIQDEINKSKT